MYTKRALHIVFRTLHIALHHRNIAQHRIIARRPPPRLFALLCTFALGTHTHTHSLTHIRTHQFRRLVNKNVSKMPSVHYTQANLCAYISAALLLCVCGSTLKRRAALMRSHHDFSMRPRGIGILRSDRAHALGRQWQRDPCVKKLSFHQPPSNQTFQEVPVYLRDMPVNISCTCTIISSEVIVFLVIF